MSFHALDDFQSRRPGFRTRPLIGTKHGFTSFFVSEFLAAEGAAIPLHTHPIEEAIVVTEDRLAVTVVHRELLHRDHIVLVDDRHHLVLEQRGERAPQVQVAGALV